MSALPSGASVEVVVPAPPRAVWEVLTDVTRVGEWSHEACSARWTQGDRASVGAVFKGANKVGNVRWSRPCTITELVEDELFTFRTDGGVLGDNTLWSFRLAPEGDGTRITETYTVENMPWLMEKFVLVALPGHRDRTEALAGDLRRLGEVAAAKTP